MNVNPFAVATSLINKMAAYKVHDDSADRMYAFVTRFLRENNYLNKDAH